MSILRKSAKGRDCQVRIPGICNFNPGTVVLAHLNGGGMGYKQNDLFGAFCCSSCHDAIDGRVRAREYSMDDLERMHLEGMTRTQGIWLEEGLIAVKGGK